MPFLRINGWRVPVRDRSSTRESATVGAIVDTMRGSSKDKRARIQHPRSFTAPCLSREEADTIIGFMSGPSKGHRWLFDADLWSADGVGPELGFTAVIAAGGRFGGFHATITEIVFAPDEPLGPLWTVIVYRRPVATWIHYAIRSDGAVFVDGVRDDAADVTWLQVTDGAVGITGAPDDFDDLVILHFEVCDRFIADSHTWQEAESRPFSALPILEVDGDVIDGRRLEAIGVADGSQPARQFGGRPPAEPSAASRWRNNARDVPFTLVPAGSSAVYP